MKRVSFFDGFDSSTIPTTEQIDSSLLVVYANDAAYVAVFGTAAEGMIYFNSTDNLIHYYNGSAWITLNDHDSLLNKGTTSHTDLDTHYADTTEHFLMLDEDNFASDSNTKTVTQQSAKAYIDNVTGGLNSFEYNETIAQGDLLRIINDSGAKVEKIIGIPESFGTEVVFESATTNEANCCYDSANDKVVVVYRDVDNSNYGTAIVGTVSGTSISFGTAVVFNSGNTSYPECCYDSTNEKIVITYMDGGNSNYGTAIVGTVSGTSISFGTEVVFESAVSTFGTCCYDSTNNKVVAVYSDGGNSDYGTAIVGTVSGTSISFGTAVVFESAASSWIGCCFDSTNDKVVVAYKDTTTGEAVVGTVSGTSISFGTPVTFESVAATYISCCYDSANNKTVITYKDSSYGSAIVGTVSGTSISFGTPVDFTSVSTNYVYCCYDSSNVKIHIAYQGTSGYGTAIVGTVSGTSISFRDEIVFNSATTTNIDCCSSIGKIITVYKDEGNSDYGTAIVADISGPEAFVGVAQEAGGAATTHNVAIIGKTSGIHSGEIPGEVAYIQTDGTLGATITDYPAGRYISATQLRVTKKP